MRRLRIVSRPLAMLLVALVLLASVPTPVRAQTPAWVEPRALNIVDLAGQVPDEQLRGIFISSDPAAGVSEFVSSEIEGDVLRITAQVYARRMDNQATGGLSTKIPLLGQRPTLDQMGSAAPESWVALYENGARLAPNGAWIEYLVPDLAQPLAGAAEPWRRYREVFVTDGVQVGEDGIYLPANYGGELGFAGDHPVLTAVYTVRLTNRPTVTLLSTQEGAFHSYIGPGNVGLLAPLMSQLRDVYGDRHERIPLSAPAAADYVLFRYPMIPLYVYDPLNLQRPSTGSVRLAPADTAMLSTDFVHSGGFPLHALWQDASQVISGSYLSRLPAAAYVSPPEYVVPANTPFNACFTAGGCPSDVLQSIHDASMTLRVLYLRVEAPESGTIEIPLRMVDELWTPEGVASPASVAPRQDGASLYLPIVAAPIGSRRDIPIGVFDRATGRMVDYLP